MSEDLILRLGLALVIGLLVGLERGWREREEPAGSRTAGIRTYTLSGLLGGVLAALSEALESEAVLVAGFLGFAGVFAWFKARELDHDQSFSVTGVIAGLGVFALGALAVVGDYRAAAAGGVALAAVLAGREMLHGLLERISWLEVRSALLLAGMTAIGLSLIPNRTIDPWGGVNPWEIWFFTVLTAAISYAGYIATRVLGPGRGVLLSGVAGAVVSSTAVTIAFGRRAKAVGPVRPLAGGAILASFVSVVRVLVIVAVVKPELAIAVAAPAVAAAAAFALAGAAILFRNAGGEPTDTPLGNPFDLGPLLLFAAGFALVSAVSAALAASFGAGGVIITSAATGVADVDVAALSAARLAGSVVPIRAAAEAVLLAVALNLLAKVAAAFAVGPIAFALPLLLATLLASIAAAAAFMLFPIV